MKTILEHVPSTEQLSLFFNRYEKNSFNFPLHYHPQWELTYIIDGSGVAYTGNEVRHFDKHELALIAPMVPHCWKSNGIKKQTVKSVFVQWDNSFLGENWLEKPEFSSIKNMFNLCHAGLSFPDTRGISEQLISMPYKSPFKRVIGFIDILHELSLQKNIEPLGQQMIILPSMASDRRIESILDHVSRFYDQKISGDDMATLISMTSVSFSKYFKRTFHKTFTQFLNEYRISQACGLLVSTEFSVEQVAYQCGYQNMSFFHRQFKIVTSNTPNNFRMNYLK